MTLSPLATGGADDPFFNHIIDPFTRATDIAVVAAFILHTGLDVLESHVEAALARGARVRVLTGNYLGITDVVGLRKLLAWADAHPGRFEGRIVDMAAPGKPGSTFHPKSWRFEGPDLAVAFVGSSNISHAALRTGVEWNLRVHRAENAPAYAEIERAFERLWAPAVALTAPWIDAYEERLRKTPSVVGAAIAQGEAPQPHDIQIEALAALARSRADEGRRRALVVLATGLGKTWLAAFDARAFIEERVTGRAPRILFLAHREEILTQAERTFRWLFLRRRPSLGVGWFAGARSELDADLVFASVQKLSRPEHLAELAARHFDYAVVDEVHHGTADSYRAVIDHLDADFLLGLTATPDRADGADVLGLFDDHVAFRADLGVGIQRGLLVPFAYWGIKDEVDYARIGWQDQRFDPLELLRAIDTRERLEQMWRAWAPHESRRTIVFCSTIEHAEHARDFLIEKGVKALAVHSGPGSAERAVALAALERGDARAVCAVDIFNEGVDVPHIDCVVMLRPTESKVVFLQQLGRGLRVASGKDRLTVIDFIGNHRIFLDRMRLFAALGDRPASVRTLIEGRPEGALPPGCTVEIDLEAKDLLLQLLGQSPGGKKAVDRAYADIVQARGVRPTLGELYRMGYPVKTVRAPDAGWFDFVADKGGLTEAEGRVREVSGEWLRFLEVTKINRSFRLLMIEAMIEASALTEGLAVVELARRSYAILRRSPELFRDIEGVRGLGDPRAPDEGRFLDYLLADEGTLDLWIKGNGRKPWFILTGGSFVPNMPFPTEDKAVFTAMTREVVDYRLVEYREKLRREQPSRRPAGRRALTAYPTLRAAAGAVHAPVEGAPEPFTVRLPTAAKGERLFAVRATGDSMDGGGRPIRDGDWLILRWVQAAGFSAVDGDVALCEVPDEEAGESYLIKRVVRAGAGWSLRSDNPAYAPREVTEGVKPLARLMTLVHPEDLGPRPGDLLADAALAGTFGLQAPPRDGRVEGHLFVLLDTAADVSRQLQQRVPDRRPGETAFVLARAPGEGMWRYLGLGRFDEKAERWILAGVDE